MGAGHSSPRFTVEQNNLETGSSPKYSTPYVILRLAKEIQGIILQGTENGTQGFTGTEKSWSRKSGTVS